MGALFALLGMVLLLSVAALALGGIGALIAIPFGYPAGWAVALALYGLGFARSGWRGFSAGIGLKGMRHNGDAAFALLHITALATGIAVASSSIPQERSALWALTLPLVFVAALLLQIGYEVLPNILNKAGRRN